MNLGRLMAIIRKEVIQIRRDRATLGLVIGIPVMELLLFGYALNTVTDHISTVLVDESGTASSRAFASAFEHSTYFDVRMKVSDRESALAAIDRGAVRVALIIPPDFGDRVLAGRPTAAQMIVDGSDPAIAQTATFAGGLVAQTQSAFATVDVASRVVPVAQTRPAIDLRPVVLYNPQMLSVQAMIPALVGMVLQLQAVLLTALAIVRERERGTLEQLIVSPIRSSELMLGKTLPNIGLCLVSTVMALGIGRLLFGVQIQGSVLELLLLTLPFLFGSLGIGLGISVVAKNQSQALQMTMFTLLPSILLSGFLFAREGMPGFFQVLSLVIPMTHYLQILRGVILKGVGVSVLWPQALTLTVFAVVVLGASISRFQKSVE